MIKNTKHYPPLIVRKNLLMTPHSFVRPASATITVMDLNPILTKTIRIPWLSQRLRLAKN